MNRHEAGPTDAHPVWDWKVAGAVPSVDQPVVVPFPHPGLGTRLPGSVWVLVCDP